MQSFPLDWITFFTKFGELMLEITRAETLYGTNLKDIGRELAALYFKWTSDLAIRKRDSHHYVSELERLEFSVYGTICEDVAKQSSELRSYLDRLFFVDTSELNITIDKTKRQKIEAEKCFSEEGNRIKGIELIKNAVDNIFEVYSNTKAKKRNLERDALKKWGGLLGAIYFPAMLVYFGILNFMEIKPDFIFGVVVPVFSAIFLLLPLFVIFSSEESVK